MSKPFGTMPARFDPDFVPSPRIAVILPGAGYSPAHPVLEFSRQALLQHGWTVQQVWWDKPEDPGEDAGAWVCDQARTAIAAENDAERILLVAKSLGTLAAPVAADLRMDAIWFTPLFDDPASIEAIARNARAGARQLLVGGGADSSWDVDQARELGADVLDLPDATHFLHVPDDAVGSTELQVKIAVAVDTFLTGLDAR